MFTELIDSPESKTKSYNTQQQCRLRLMLERNKLIDVLNLPGIKNMAGC